MVARSLAIIASAARQWLGFIAMNAVRALMPRSLPFLAGATATVVMMIRATALAASKRRQGPEARSRPT